MNHVAVQSSSQNSMSHSENYNSPINSYIDSIDVEKSFKCKHPGCRATFSKHSKLAIHIRQHTGERPYKCDFNDCDKSYTNASHLKRHIQTHQIVKHSFKCSKCSLMISNRQNLKRHYERVHSENTPFFCKECDLKFVKELKYKEHMAIHEGIALYECKICLRKFMTYATFKKHERSHVKKEYRCEASNCSEVFDKWSLLCKHRSSKHISEYKCKVCKKVFLNKTQLKSHSIVHEDNRLTFPCPYEKCPRFYFFKRNLEHHVRTTHLGKKYHCDICDMKLSCKQKIIHHMKKIHLKKKKKKKKKKIHSESERKQRTDAGIAKKSMLSKLVGLDLPRSIEKELLNRKTKIQFSDEGSVQTSKEIVENYGQTPVVGSTSTNEFEEITRDGTDRVSAAKIDVPNVVNELSDRIDERELLNCEVTLVEAAMIR